MYNAHNVVKPLYNTQLRIDNIIYSIYRILFPFRVFSIHSEHTQFSINALSIHPFIYLSSICVCVFDIGENPIMPTGKTRGGNVEPITELGPKVVG
jgi:hypothetical protein